MPIPANRARFTLSVAQLATPLQVLKFSGHEALSEPFRFELEVIATRPDLDLDGLLNRDACLRIQGEQTRLVHGTLGALAQGVTTRRLTHYHLTLVPRLHWLGLRRNVRIFRNLSVPEIVRQVLDEANLGATFQRIELTRDYEPRTYCVQYNETELAFIQRLLAEEGIHYHFEHFEDRHVLVMADHGEAFVPLKPRALSFRATAGMAGEASVLTFQQHQAVAVEGLWLNDYDGYRPNRSLMAQAGDGASALAAYHWPGRYREGAVGERRVSDRLDQARIEQQCAKGTSLHTHLVPGRVFQLTDHPRADTNADYLIQEVHHEGIQPQVLEEFAGDEGSRYHNSFKVLPAHQRYRPPHRHSKPIAQTQTAVVIGPSDEQIHTNEHGELQVRFHWDREGKHSCWLRLAQSWAGNHWGGMVVPRVGQEVVVAFVDGDPDHPLITGCLYHGLHKPPYALPEHASRSLIRSQSLAGGKSHELMLEDRAGQETIGLNSARDLELDVVQDQRTSIGRHAQTQIAGDQVATTAGTQHHQVGGERRVRIHGDDSLSVEQALHLKAGQDLLESAGQALHYKAGQRIVIEAGTAIHLKAGAGSVVIDATGVHLNGPMIGLNGGGGGGAAQGATPALPSSAATLAPPPSGQSTKHASPQQHELSALKFRALSDALNPSVLERAIAEAANVVAECRLCAEGSGAPHEHG